MNELDVDIQHWGAVWLKGDGFHISVQHAIDLVPLRAYCRLILGDVIVAPVLNQRITLHPHVPQLTISMNNATLMFGKFSDPRIVQIWRYHQRHVCVLSDIEGFANSMVNHINGDTLSRLRFSHERTLSGGIVDDMTQWTCFEFDVSTAPVIERPPQFYQPSGMYHTFRDNAGAIRQTTERLAEKQYHRFVASGYGYLGLYQRVTS